MDKLKRYSLMKTGDTGPNMKASRDGLLEEGKEVAMNEEATKAGVWR
jgi:hypothetical protein